MTDLVKSLRVLAGDRWVPLAGWARFFITLGNTLGASEDDHSRKVVAVTVPARAFVASFCALGVVLSRVRVMPSADPLAYFERLRSLPAGTTVFYRWGPTKKRRCRFGGIVDRDGKEYAMLEDAETLCHLVPPAHCLKIEPSEGTMAERPQVPRTVNVSANREFLVALLGGAGADEFLRYSRIDCVITGLESELRADITETVVAIATRDDKFVQGRLQDVVRVRRFLGHGPYKSDVISARSPGGNAGDLPRAPVVIFDGAAPVFRWFAMSVPGWFLVILDRTETRFADAVAEINRRRAGGTPIALPTPPDGVELTAFVENVTSGAA
jgi:hypothetical protein